MNKVKRPKRIGIKTTTRICPPGYLHVVAWAAQYGIGSKQAHNWARSRVPYSAQRRVGRFLYIQEGFTCVS